MSGSVLRIFLAVVALVGLTACGGGSESEAGGSTTAGGGIGGTGVSAGSITGFGSIFVNGVEFSTNGATIMKDDVAVSESELRRGMMVEVRGSIDSDTSGIANTVTVEEAVRGPVESRTGSANAGILVVLGQTVLVDDTTLIDDNVCDTGEPCTTPAQRFTAIGVGDLLEVHGHRRADASIVATFIERKTAPVVFVVRGTIANHDAAAQTFSIGALAVAYGGGADIGDMPAPVDSNWNGLFVEVKGNTCSGPAPACGTLTATKVEPEGLGVANAARAEIEGFVTTVAGPSPSEFTVGHQRIVTNASTVFAGGLPSEIVLGVKLEVEGTLAGGVLTATKVQFKDSVKLESNASVSADGSTVTLEGLPGVTVTANAFTEFRNNTGGATASKLALLNGRNVRIRGRASGATSVIATEIEDRGASTQNVDVILQGVATNVGDPMFKILGVEVNTSQLDDPADFEGVNDQPIGRAAFFSALTPNGGLVKARGQLPAANAMAADRLKEVELED